MVYIAPHSYECAFDSLYYDMANATMHDNVQRGRPSCVHCSYHYSAHVFHHNDSPVGSKSLSYYSTVKSCIIIGTLAFEKNV